MLDKQDKMQEEEEVEKEEPQEPVTVAPAPLGVKTKHKLTLTNIVEEEISPTSKSSASILSKPKGTKTAQANAAESNDPSRKFESNQGISTNDDKELLEEQSLHSGSVERYLLNHSAGQLVAKEKELEEAKKQV